MYPFENMKGWQLVCEDYTYSLHTAEFFLEIFVGYLH
jgi:hypothetical protein